MSKILLIDDHSDIRRLIRITLGNRFEVYEAEDGVSGLKVALEMVPDLIVLDIMMPGSLDGLQVLERVRGAQILSHTRVILVTARGQTADYEDGIRRGADGYFIKPFSPLKLVAAIKDLLSS